MSISFPSSSLRDDLPKLSKNYPAKPKQAHPSPGDLYDFYYQKRVRVQKCMKIITSYLGEKFFNHTNLSLLTREISTGMKWPILPVINPKTLALLPPCLTPIDMDTKERMALSQKEKENLFDSLMVKENPEFWDRIRQIATLFEAAKLTPQYFGSKGFGDIKKRFKCVILFKIATDSFKLSAYFLNFKVHQKIETEKQKKEDCYYVLNIGKKIHNTLADSKIYDQFFLKNRSVNSELPIGTDKQIWYFTGGNSIDYTTGAWGEKLDDSYWNSWRNLVGSELAAKEYGLYLVPLCLDYLDQLIKPHSRILEVCGGDGFLARQIFDRFASKLEAYYLVERNKKSVSACMNRFANEPRMKIHQEDVTRCHFFNICNNQKVDMVMGLGALTADVLERNEAVHVFENVIRTLRIGGVVLLAGFGESHITSQLLTKNGFKLHNCYYHDRFLQFYVAIKKSEVPFSNLFRCVESF